MGTKGYKYRIYPTDAQKGLLMKTFGCARFVYNQALDWKKKAYRVGGISMSYNDTAYGLTKTKSFYPWLKEVDSAALQQSLRHLDKAFRAFFEKRTKYPKFKKRGKCRFSYTTPMNGKSIKVGTKNISLPKLGRVKAVIHRPLPENCVIKSATVSMEKDGTFYVSICTEVSECTIPRPVEKTLGLDYKSDGLAATSDGEVFGSLKSYRKMEKRIAKAQRSMRRKQSKSNNKKKADRKVAKLYRKEANQRKDYLHKLSFDLASRYDLICVEDLNMRDLANHGFHNGKATLDNGFGAFRQMLEYKLADRGKYFQKIDKFFPSSQKCSVCGYKNPEVKNLNVKNWICPVCNTHHDRDFNAAENIRIEGVRLFGESHPFVVRPVRPEPVI